MNIGNENATNTTITQLTGAGCLPQIASLDKLNAGESYTEISFFCTCTGIGWQKVIAHANIYGVQHQYETTYTNNEREASYFCLGGSSKPMCWDYV